MHQIFSFLNANLSFYAIIMRNLRRFALARHGAKARKRWIMESSLVALGVQTFKITLMLSLPMLLAGLFAGLIISIFQATTQINEMTLSFVPKILLVVVVLIFIMPWMMNMMMDFTTGLFNQIPALIR